MDIMDNMDAARFRSANVNEMKKQPEKENENKAKGTEEKTPMVIRNLNNQ